MKIVKKATFFIMIGIMLFSPTIGNNKIQANEKQIKSQIFYEAPEISSDYMYLWSKLNISQFVSEVNEYYEGEDMPEAVANYINVTLPTLADEHNAVIDEINEIGANNNLDTFAYKKYLTSLQKYYFNSYNEFVPIYNEYLSEIDGVNVSSLIDNLRYDYSNWAHYSQLGYSENMYLDSEKNYISTLYDRIYNDLSQVIDDQTEVEEKTLDILKKSVIKWIEEVDIDYIIAYQHQVNQYLDTIIELGYVVENDNTLVLDEGQPNTRKPVLSDFSQFSMLNFYLNSYFHDLTLDENGTDFLTPEEIFASDGFQELVDNVTYYLNNLTESDKDSVVNAIHATIAGQYSALFAPGSTSQPATQALPYSLSHFGWDLTNSSTKKDLPLLTSWISPETQEAPYDTYRHLNYLKVPYVDLEEELSQKVTRTIKYEFEDGTKAADTVVQKVTFKGSKNLINNLTTWEDDELSFKAVSNPKVSHSNKRVSVLKANKTVKEEKVTVDSKNTTIRVVYPMEISAKVHYVNQDGKKIYQSKTIQGRYNTEYKVNAPDIKGYKIYSVPKNAKGIYNLDMKDITFVYKKDTSNNGDLPDTGQTLMPIYIVMLLSIAAGVIAYIRVKKNN